MNFNTNIYQTLTKDEKETFSIIKNVVEKYTPSTKVFVVGGWVRDKILGFNPHDIDIMISNMSGEDFAKLVTKHLNLKDPHVIQANPEASKHVTTAKAYIPLSSGNIQEIDFAQARTEVYQESTRIPQVQPATPQEDATRRDLTINSIFYNITENKLEDFTGMGIKDLISNTIRTPLDPYKTFSEDPLRIFRTIVFSAKYNWKIDEETYKALSDPSLRNEINNKVSKERIGQEFLKMLKNPNPHVSIQILKDTGLWDDIIKQAIKTSKYEENIAELDMNQNNPNHVLNLWGHTMEVVKNISEKYKDSDPEKRTIMLLSALMHDLGKLYKNIWGTKDQHTSYIGHEEESAKISEMILRYLKMDNNLVNNVSKLSELHMRPHNLGEEKSLRKFIRQMGEKSLNWLDVFNLAMADALAKDKIQSPEIVEKYQNLENRLHEAVTSLSIKEETAVKPILNGQEIMSILNIKPGKHMKEITEFVSEMKDENPNITKEKASQLLKEKYDLNKIASQKQSSLHICPKHLLSKEIKGINNLFKEQRYYEILTKINELRTEYGKDESVIRLISIATFKLLLKDKQYKNLETISFLADNMGRLFFDPVICAYALGTFIMVETSINEKDLENIGLKIIVMHPEKTKKVFHMLPDNIFHGKIKKILDKKI